MQLHSLDMQLDVQPFPTVASLARDQFHSTPQQVAMRVKRLGVWEEYSWGKIWELIETSAHALLALDVQVGDRVAIHSENRPEWVILDLATVAVRAITVGLYPTNPTAEVAHLISDCKPAIFVAEDQEQADKVLAIPADETSSVRHIIYLEAQEFNRYDDQEFNRYDDARLLCWDSFLEIGRAHRRGSREAVANIMVQATGDDIATLVYTSGTTGPPKGAMLSNHNVAYAVEKVVNETSRFPSRWPLAHKRPASSKDTILTYLPLCHVAERLFSTWTLVGAGPSLNFAESIGSVMQNLREVQPSLFFAVPRIWEKLHASIMMKSQDATPFKRVVLNIAFTLARFIGEQKASNSGEHTALSRAAYYIGQPLAFRAMKEKLGLQHCRHAASGAAPISPDILSFFVGIGVPVFELYGMTENVAIATCNFAGRMKLGTVGEPYQDIGFRIDTDTGEIQVKHPGVFAGYWNMPQKTAETFTDDGWLKTGDVGVWMDGTHVKIVDRIKNIIITSGGKNISPSEIENKLKTSPYVKEAMVIGDGRKYVTALIGIEFETVGTWAQSNNISYTTYQDLSSRSEVVTLISNVVSKCNTAFSKVEQIKKFRLIPMELNHETGELTATQKVKRQNMERAFEALIESMYT